MALYFGGCRFYSVSAIPYISTFYTPFFYILGSYQKPRRIRNLYSEFDTDPCDIMLEACSARWVCYKFLTWYWALIDKVEDFELLYDSFKKVYICDFKILEDELLGTDKYVSIDKKNYKTFSSKYMQLFLSIVRDRGVS